MNVSENTTMENATLNSDDLILSCPEIQSKETRAIINGAAFWIEGVVCLCVALPGFLGNIGSSYILATKDMRNSFNLLLIALATFDNIYLFGGFITQISLIAGQQFTWQIVLFPYLLYPLNTIAMTGSIFLTVAIALERYIAVHHPLNYSQTSTDGKALRQRMYNYLMPVTFLSLLFNVTKFFEATYDYEPIPSQESGDGGNSTRPVLKPTALRTNPLYSIYFNWFRFIAVGIVPFGLLVLFNARIYIALRLRRKRAGFRRAQAGISTVTQTHVQHSPVRATITVMPPDEVDEAASSSLGNPFSHDDNGDGAAIHLLAVGPHPDQEEEDDVREQKQHAGGSSNANGGVDAAAAVSGSVGSGSKKGSSAGEEREEEQEAASALVTSEDSDSTSDKKGAGSKSRGLKKVGEDQDSGKDKVEASLSGWQTPEQQQQPRVKFSVKDENIQNGVNSLSVPSARRQSEENGEANTESNKKSGRKKKGESSSKEKLKDFYNSSIRRYRMQRCSTKRSSGNSSCSSCIVVSPTADQENGAASGKKTRREVARANARRRRMEDHMATIFMGYILVFLVCHSPRLILNIYELFTIRHALDCRKAGLPPFPDWSLILTNFSHLMLTVNSSINILIYCMLSSKFREEVVKTTRRIFGKFAVRR